MGLKSTFLDLFCLREKYEISFIFETFGKKIIKMMHHTYMYETIRDIDEKNDDEEMLDLPARAY